MSHPCAVDQPVGTGYSYAEVSTDYVNNETAVAEVRLPRWLAIRA